MQRLYIGYIVYTCGVRYSVIEKLSCNHCYRYATRMYRLYFNNLTRVFYTKAGGMYIRGIFTLSFILYSLFIKYFKFIYNLKKFIYALYIYRLSVV